MSERAENSEHTVGDLRQENLVQANKTLDVYLSELLADEENLLDFQLSFTLNIH